VNAGVLTTADNSVPEDNFILGLTWRDQSDGAQFTKKILTYALFVHVFGRQVEKYLLGIPVEEGSQILLHLLDLKQSPRSKAPTSIEIKFNNGIWL
jgi:hypothetical protein